MPQTTLYDRTGASVGSVDLSVVVPCFNEEGNLDVLVDRMRRVFATHAIAAELIVAREALPRTPALSLASH